MQKASASIRKMFQEIGAEILAQATSKPSSDEKKVVADRLSKMIDYAIKRQDWYEDQRNKILGLGLALLGLSSFLVSGLLNKEVESMPCFRLTATATLLAITFTAVRVVHLYAVGGSQKYTHRNLADIRSWYFAYVVKDDVLDASIDDPILKSENSKILSQAWEKFVKGWDEYRKNENGFLIEDLQQVFVLYLFQGMRRKSLRTMIEAASSGGYYIAILLSFTIVFAGFRM